MGANSYRYSKILRKIKHFAVNKTNKTVRWFRNSRYVSWMWHLTESEKRCKTVWEHAMNTTKSIFFISVDPQDCHDLFVLTFGHPEHISFWFWLGPYTSRSQSFFCGCRKFYRLSLKPYHFSVKTFNLRSLVENLLTVYLSHFFSGS